MKTYILFWNPAISSYKQENFQEALEEIGFSDMNWNVWEHENANVGDRFFMVRCGDGNTGICMSGYFMSDPYQDEDWSGKGRKTYYMDLEPDVMINSDYLPILTTTELASAIPEFDWKGGHSGRLLDAHLAEKLEGLWDKFLDEHSNMFYIHAAAQEVDTSSYTSKNDDKQTVNLRFTWEGKIVAANYTCNIEIDGSDLESVKKQTIEEIYKITGKKPEIIFKYDDVDEKYWPLYEKAITMVLANKKENDSFHSYYEFENEVSYWFYKVGISSVEAKKQGFPDGVIKVLKALERKKGESYLKYVKRAAKNEYARDIIEDEIKDALDLSKRESISVDDVQTINDHLAAMRYLDSLDDSE